MTNNKITNPILISRIIGVCASLWLLVKISLSINYVWHTTIFQATNFGGKIALLTTTAPPLILAVLILLPWRQLAKSSFWSALLCALVICVGLYLYNIFIVAPKDGYLFVLFALIVIIAQIISILKIRQIAIIQNKQNGSSLYNKPILQRQLGAVIFLSLIIGAGLDLMHYSWMNYSWSKQVVIMGFTVSVPIVVLALIGFAMIIKPSQKVGCTCLCFFSIPISVVAMYYTYRSAMLRYHLGSETGMAIIFGVIPAMLIGLFFALWIYFTYKANLRTENTKDY